MGIGSFRVPVISVEPVADQTIKFTFLAPEIAIAAKPCQFVNVRVSDSVDALLRKPFSIYDVADDRISIVVKLIGPGTRLLAKKQVGDFVDVLGPLGTPFTLDSTKTVAFVGGGVGIASLRMLASHLPKFDLFYGVRSKSELIEIAWWNQRANRVFIASDDGSIGNHGRISGPFQTYGTAYDTIVTCGPHPMMNAIVALSAPQQATWCVTESYMACGFGVCMGCVIETVDGYQRVCREGPVFSGRELVWSTT